MKFFALALLFGVLSVAAVTDVELIYFGLKGRAEAIRLILHYGGIPFRDTRVTAEEWTRIKYDKSRFPYAVIPVLQVNRTIIAETSVITRFVARITNLDHSYDPLDQARIDEVYEVASDFFNEVIHYISGTVEGTKVVTQADYNTLFLPHVQKYLPLVEKFIRENANGLFSRRGLSYTDFFWASVVDWINDIHPEIVQQHPISAAHRIRILSLPQLQPYLRTQGHRVVL
ncbi:unnamed protein product [Bursaphelenchus xylophilus]|uniref:(pine wood nematode) hypothetical protein n=1 Tax=Bursaphelenchus xylophilus TaxID=6326 RepID=A0A1I7RQJ5_BURXY|nr:unnamed protein product [Bursaphelenchus xylophilus]CAG9104691.1 unnamed protein product [Bursaphelenchus xylophilus]